MINEQIILMVVYPAARACEARSLRGRGFGPGECSSKAGCTDATLVARACAARSSRELEFGPGISSGEAGVTNARQAAGVYPSGLSFLDGIGGAQQTGPPRYPAKPGNDLSVTPTGPQRDLFGTPFGPPFSIQTDAKYANLPDIRRNPARGTQVCTKQGVLRGTGSWRRGATSNGRRPFPARPLPDGRRAARWPLLVIPSLALVGRIEGGSATALLQPRDTPAQECLSPRLVSPVWRLISGLAAFYCRAAS